MVNTDHRLNGGGVDPAAIQQWKQSCDEVLKLLLERSPIEFKNEIRVVQIMIRSFLEKNIKKLHKKPCGEYELEGGMSRR